MAGKLLLYYKIFKSGWHPGSDLTRRVPTETGKRYELANYLLPSGSWEGWQEEVDFSDWYTGNDFVAIYDGWIGLSRKETSPVTIWYTSNDSSGMAENRRIEAEWSKWRDRYRITVKRLPAGWKKHRRRTSEPLSASHP